MTLLAITFCDHTQSLRDVPCPLIGEPRTSALVIEMFHNKVFDLTRALSLFSNAWGQVRTYHVYGHRRNPLQPLQRKDRDALRRIEFNREMAMAYAQRTQQTIH